MPVPSTIADLSSTASSNYPSGSESIGTSLDDYLRAHASIIKQVSDAKADTSHTQAASTISDSTAAGRTLLTAADASAQRTALGLGTAATKDTGTGANNVVVHDASGNVGIGKTPSVRLDVQCATGAAAAAFTDGTYGTVFVSFDGTYGVKIFNAGSSALSLGANNNINLQITNTGKVRVITATGLGYGPGSGGSVVQSTSRTTAVTINKPTGTITMVGAAGSASWSSFRVFNSTVSIGDTVVLSIQNGAINVYNLSVMNVQNGSFDIFFVASGTAVDAPVINFAVINGSST